jgi:membrane associated rhomboid family serine protease
MWLVFYVELFFGLPLRFYGIEPRTPHGLIGIFAAPLLHGDFLHLVSNTLPMLFLGWVLFFFYGRIGGQVFIRAYFWTNILVWLFAFPGNHIGASGIVYCLAFFLIFFGLLRRDFLSLFISVIVFLLYGGVFFGIFPGDPSISWESHFSGALVGIMTAFTFSKQTKV